MVGDDIENDVKAAQDMGGIGILIYTGKTKFPLDKSLNMKPDFEVNTLKELILLFKQVL